MSTLNRPRESIRFRDRLGERDSLYKSLRDSVCNICHPCPSSPSHPRFRHVGREHAQGSEASITRTGVVTIWVEEGPHPNPEIHDRPFSPITNTRTSLGVNIFFANAFYDDNYLPEHCFRK